MLHELSVERSFWEEIFTGKHTSLKFDFFDLSSKRDWRLFEQPLKAGLFGARDASKGDRPLFSESGLLC
jgi:hypothetical protein